MDERSSHNIKGDDESYPELPSILINPEFFCQQNKALVLLYYFEMKSRDGHKPLVRWFALVRLLP